MSHPGPSPSGIVLSLCPSPGSPFLWPGMCLGPALHCLTLVPMSSDLKPWGCFGMSVSMVLACAQSEPASAPPTDLWGTPGTKSSLLREAVVKIKALVHHPQAILAVPLVLQGSLWPSLRVSIHRCLSTPQWLSSLPISQWRAGPRPPASQGLNPAQGLVPRVSA